jgi:hypothetical protein
MHDLVHNYNLGPYYLQAAMDDSMPNPFLNDDLGAPMQQQSNPADSGDFIGGSSGQQIPRPVPPMRPPPPQAAISVTSSPAHPVVAGHVVGPAQPKSAFDDLNDSIRMALGGSPSKASPIGGGGGSKLVGQDLEQTSFTAFGGIQPPHQQPQQQMFSSSAMQPLVGGLYLILLFCFFVILCSLLLFDFDFVLFVVSFSLFDFAFRFVVF